MKLTIENIIIDSMAGIILLKDAFTCGGTSPPIFTLNLSILESLK